MFRRISPLHENFDADFGMVVCPESEIRLFVSPDSAVAWLFIGTIWFGVLFVPGVLGLVRRTVRDNYFA